MKKINIRFGETTLACTVATDIHMTDEVGFDMSKSSPGFATPITEIIGKVSSVTKVYDSMSFDIEDHTFYIARDCPEWLRPGVRVKVGLYDKSILLLDENEQ